MFFCTVLFGFRLSVKWEIEELRERGVNFRSLTDSIDTSTPMGRFFFHIMGALAEMERELIVERTRAGLEAARAQAGRLIGAGIPRQQHY
ncbi:recombinase family protein [Salmonella enterica]|nr:recombinase family protein [Salmonella enterica]ECS6612400.1 recombinase family protein [Salmonella enterica subsp. enterica serovar Give]EAW8074115.1 recombinase family protein [Salmonella enterica]EAZ6211371.1 recombinase family protein [Salmonella enterica]EBT8902457.1 recombinase family protein [Salmonella enterica]